MRKGRSYRCSIIGLAVIWACSLIQLSPAQAANPLAGCGFDFDTLSFSGTELQQAKCLLRPTKKGGNLGPALAVLPAPLEKVIGTPLKLDLVRFREYLVEQRIAPDALGGSLDVPLSRSAAGSKPTVRYFVIHDTSSNQCEDVAALSKSDDPNASWNTIKRWSNNDQAHLYLTRDGKLIAPQGRTFAVPFYATKLEKKNPDRTRGLFLHIENVQLRNVEVKPGEKTRDKDNECVNDRIAQKPGFTSVQYSRLALVYIAASHRAGKWLVPAYHLAVDDGVGSAHDDPQNFDLSQLGQNVCRHLTALDRNDCAP